jgi:hypothetical protein
MDAPAILAIGQALPTLRRKSQPTNQTSKSFPEATTAAFDEDHGLVA